MTKQRFFSAPPADLQAAGFPDTTAFVSAGYLAKPLKGQWYISGARPCAYRAPNLLQQEHLIAYPVRRRGAGCGYEILPHSMEAHES